MVEEVMFGYYVEYKMMIDLKEMVQIFMLLLMF
eukprot:CAMPEP_0201584964 /NCGR_PEP_ID=MMETSP0190_2-20130828/116877_1 /ASSEMBLY_ACC=CAM_ASM_000263 /TAXON_ID=37353 /ORGANISM="Rosalina sp." /LENGTH=32 /DNA_ID= /DNA_START= /DNA_END= /DNA_ORIENTATION=